MTKVDIVNIHEAKTHLSRLIRQVIAGGEVIIDEIDHLIENPGASVADPRAILIMADI